MSTKLCPTRRLLAAGIMFFIVSPLAAQWENVTANLAGLPSECGNMCLLSAVPGQDKIIAGIAKRGLGQTTDGGTNTGLGRSRRGSRPVAALSGCRAPGPAIVCARCDET